MKLQLLLVLTVSCALAAKSKDHDDDESRPYEFGFTIDGQQHRHESKDINGIIMGEFGFITADGVYHVTVYATDENGSFKILSMRNIKISEPLDTPGYKFPEKVPSGNPRPVKEITTTTTTVRTITTVAKGPYQFTTVPSLNKPSCSSCRLPSTTPRPPGVAPGSHKLPFQTPQFQPGYKKPENKPNGNAPGIGNRPGSQPFGQKPVNGNQPFGQQPFGQQPFGQQPNGIRPGSPQNNFNQPGNNYNNNFNVNNDYVNNYNGNNGQNPVKPAIEQQPPYKNPGQNEIPSRKPARAPASLPPKVTISNGMIDVPGKPPIPIKDKYPGMHDGLPAGITQNDMLDLLYKFNYTVGFHGHHERGLKNGAKIGGYFVNGRDGISRVVEYIADENGYRPKVKFINLGLDSPYTPKEGTEKTFGLQGFEFVWYPV